MSYEKMAKDNGRFANVELLRIFCTLSIIASHMISYPLFIF